MAEYRRGFQQPDPTGPDKWSMRGGDFRWYFPDRLTETPVQLDETTAVLLGRVTERVAELGERFAHLPLPALYATLLRSESIASSRIEGVREDPSQVLLAGIDESLLRSNSAAVLINRNIDLVREAVESLATQTTWTTADIDGLHSALLPEDRSGFRRQLVWISGRTPVQAKYVAPLHEHVPELMKDLVDYLEYNNDPPLVQAALTHAQLETIHPWADGNGRTGRALIQAVLGRSGLVRGGVLPVSVIFGHRDSGYITALNTFRYDPRRGGDAVTAQNAFIRFFLESADAAVEVAADLIDDVQRVSSSWSERTAGVRAHSAQHRLLSLLVDRPVLTVGYAQANTEYSDAAGQRRAYSRVALGNAFAELERKGIVERMPTRDGRSIVYRASEIVDLLVLSERRLGSAELDTVAAPLSKAAPPAHSATPGRPACRPRPVIGATQQQARGARDVTQPPIADYAMLTNRRSAALVAHGSIDWLCAPRFDSPAVFARLLGDIHNGYWRIAPVDGRESGRSYRDHSFVLDTHWEAPRGTVTATDFLVQDDGEVPTLSLVRTVTCTDGEADIAVDLVMRFDYGRVTPWVRRVSDPQGEQVLQALAGPDALTLHGPRLVGEERSHHNVFHLENGESLTWVLTWHPPHLVTPAALDADAALESILEDWNGWQDEVGADGPYGEAVDRSLEVLRGLTLHHTGGIVAAATTSLPEAIGGERNWDYRYTWLRDSAFTISILACHGHRHVARHWRNWLLRAIAGDPEDLQIMYGVDGTRRLTEQTLDHLDGYRGSRPVRIGNGAYSQYQADVIGEVMVALADLRDAGVDETDFSWALQKNLLSLVATRLDEPDHGIWEMRGEPRLFTHGRVMMWAAFDRGIQAVERDGLTGPADRWREHRDALRREILDRGVRNGAFVQHYDTDCFDASLLQIPQVGFVAADDAVMLGTVARIEAELLDDHGFVRRYLTDGSDGLQGEEGAFLMCTFWLVEQYARSGRREEAARLMDRLLAVRNDVGLLAEEYDATTDSLLGNFPQAFSHLALLRAAHALS